MLTGTVNSAFVCGNSSRRDKINPKYLSVSSLAWWWCYFWSKTARFRKKSKRQSQDARLKKALSERVKAGDVFVVQDFKLESHKTKDFLLALKALKVAARTVLIVSERNVNLLLGSRNVADVTVTSGERLNTYEALLCDKMIFTKSAFEIVGHRLSAK